MTKGHDQDLNGAQAFAAETAADMARDIVAKAAEISAGTTTFIPYMDYENVDVSNIIFLLQRLGIDRAETSDLEPPTPDQTQRMNTILGSESPSWDTVYEAATTIRTFMARQAWEQMVATELEPDSGAYTCLHCRLSELNIDPQSDAVLTLLDTTRDQFRRVDQAQALNKIYDVMTEDDMLTNIALAQDAADYKTQRDGKPVDMTEEFMKQVLQKAKLQVEEVMDIINQSELDMTQVGHYMNMRRPELAPPPEDGEFFHSLSRGTSKGPGGLH